MQRQQLSLHLLELPLLRLVLQLEVVLRLVESLHLEVLAHFPRARLAAFHPRNLARLLRLLGFSCPILIFPVRTVRLRLTAEIRRF